MTQPMAPGAVRRRAMSLALAFFLWAAVLLLVVKLLLAQAVGSLSLLACALHSLLLCFSSLLGLQSLGKPRRASAAAAASHRPLAGGTGLFAMVMALLLWALLGFGGFSLLGELLRRGSAGWLTETTAMLLPAEGADAAGNASLLIAGGLKAAVLHPALLPMLGILAVLGFGLAFLARLCARHLSSRTLAFQSYLLLQDGWLVLIAGVALVALGQGVTILESLGALGILAMVWADAWRWLGIHMPHWRQGMAIAPEAIIATAQQVDGVIGCQVLSCQGMVGRRLAIALEIRLHPEFESMRHRLGRRVCHSLERRYGPAQVELFLVSKLGGARRRLNLSLDDEVSWVDEAGEGEL